MEQSTSPKVTGAESPACKLYVKNIHKNTTQRSLEEYFQKFGTLTEVSLIMEPTGGVNRGYAFITFESDKSVDDCLLCTSHSLDDRELDVRRVMPKTIPDPLLQTKTNRIFLGGLPQGVTEQDITDYFNNKYSNLGEVKEVIIKKDRQTGRPRGFCFTSFSSYHVVDKITVEDRFPVISNKKCEVRKADSSLPMTGAPPANMSMVPSSGPGVRNNGMSDRRSGGYGMNGPSGGRYGGGPRNHIRADMGYGGNTGGYHQGRSNLYGSGPGMDDFSMGGMGYAGGSGYYQPYSATQHGSYGLAPSGGHGHSSYPIGGAVGSGHPAASGGHYDSMPQAVGDRHYNQSGGYASMAVPSASSHGYDSHQLASQRSSIYGSGAPSSHMTQPSSTDYYQSSLYGNSGSQQQSMSSSGGSVAAAAVAASSHPYGSGQQTGSSSVSSTGSQSAYGSSYAHSAGVSSVGQTVSYPTRSYRPPTAAQASQSSLQQQVGATSSSLTQHRPY